MSSLDPLSTLAATERRVAMATLVATRGTTPHREGARMWVGEGGRILGSVTIGGCVDARVVAEAEEVLATARARRIAMALGDEDAWDLGLTCGGTVEVLIEPLDLRRPEQPAVAACERVRAELAAGRAAVGVTPLDERAERMVVLAGGATFGTLGDEAADEAARAAGRRLLRGGASTVATLHGAAGPIDVFLELHAPPDTLLVFGAGQVSMPLVALAKELGLRAVVVDGRGRFATRERFPRADELRVGIPSEIAGAYEYGPSTLVVLVAHDYKYDLPVLRTVLAGEAGYVGLLGSRRRGAAILRELAAQGVAPERLARVRTPIGLDIGARSAAEIALAILAEALAVRRARGGGPLHRDAAAAAHARRRD